MGIPVPEGTSPFDPELRLYRLLCREEGRGAYSRYNSLLRRLVSFERALEQRRARQPRPRPTGTESGEEEL